MLYFLWSKLCHQAGLSYEKKKSRSRFKSVTFSPHPFCVCACVHSMRQEQKGSLWFLSIRFSSLFLSPSLIFSTFLCLVSVARGTERKGLRFIFMHRHRRTLVVHTGLESCTRRLWGDFPGDIRLGIERGYRVSGLFKGFLFDAQLKVSLYVACDK